MTETQWLNTSDHPIARSIRMLKAMRDHFPQDKLVRDNMRRLVLEARAKGLTNPTERQNLVASVVGWEAQL